MYDNAETGLHIYDEVNDDKVLTARAGGLIGIGTNNPDVELHVQRTTTSPSYNYATRYVAAFERNGACDVAIRASSSHSSSLSFSDEADADVGRIYYDHSNNSMQFKTNAGDRMLIDSDGKVGIGETAPLGKLHVKSADSGQSAADSSADELVVEGSGAVSYTHLRAHETLR